MTRSLKLLNRDREKQIHKQSLRQPSSYHLSIIIPAYNEELRLGEMLDNTLEYIKKKLPNRKIEIILVDDGSTDKTIQIFESIALNQSLSNSSLACIDFKVHKLFKNGGKGRAVREVKFEIVIIFLKHLM